MASPNHHYPRLLRYDDVAEIIGVQPTTVRQWVSSGKIPHLKIGHGRRSVVRFDAGQLDGWLRQWRRGAGVGSALTSSLLFLAMTLMAEAVNRSAIARIGGFSRAAMYDGREVTTQARAGFLRRFEAEVDPERTLPPQERERRARAALKAHMGRLALRSAEARRRR
jgi:excisionase family DNA binding protein